MKAFNYGQLLALAIGDPHAPTAEYIEDSTFRRTPAGAHFSLPTGAFLQLDLGADDIAGDETRAVLRPPDFPVERSTALLDLVTTFTVSATRGRIPTGVLPAVTMQAESATAGADGDPGIADEEYHTGSVVEAKSSYTTQLVLEAGRSVNVSAFVEESHRMAVKQELLKQIINGTGLLNNLAGILGVAGISAATYAQTDRGDHPPFLVAEAAVEDADSDPMTSAWLLGSDLSDSARSSAIDPGSFKRTEEAKRMSLSGYRSFRSDSVIPATTGLFCDWASVILITQGDLQVTVDRVTKPGEVRITSRLPVAGPLLARPGRIYKLEQA